MGDVAEMMLEGLLCSGCGIVIDDDAPGHPRKCNDCTKELFKRIMLRHQQIACQHCGTVGENKIGPGKGPHAGALICTACGKWIKWLSKEFMKTKGKNIGKEIKKDGRQNRNAGKALH